jgi:hypothetical protein
MNGSPSAAEILADGRGIAQARHKIQIDNVMKRLQQRASEKRQRACIFNSDSKKCRLLIILRK